MKKSSFTTEASSPLNLNLQQHPDILIKIMKNISLLALVKVLAGLGGSAVIIGVLRKLILARKKLAEVEKMRKFSRE